MPNPYRDEIGRYASKEEMGAAVNSLYERAVGAPSESERAEAMGEWFTLKHKYDNLVSGRVEMPAEWVSRVASSGMAAIPHDAAGLRVYYEAVQDDLRDRAGNEPRIQANRALRMMREANLPQDIRDDILQHASPGVKAEIISAFSNADSPATSMDILRMVPESGEIDPNITEQIIYSQKLTFEDRFNVAKRGKMTSLLILTDSGAILKNAETEREVVDAFLDEGELRKTGDQFSYVPHNSYDRAWATLAGESRSKRVHGLVMERYLDQPVANEQVPLAQLVSNRRLSATQLNEIMSHEAEHDPVSFDKLAQSFARGYHEGDPGRSLYRAIRHENFDGLRDVPNTPLTAEQRSRYEAIAKAAPEQRAGVLAQSHLDAEPDAYKQLKREYRRASRGRDAKSVDQAKDLAGRIKLAGIAIAVRKIMTYANRGGE